MNKKLLILTIALMKNGYSFPKEQSKKIKQILLFVVLALSLLPMAYGIISFLRLRIYCPFPLNHRIFWVRNLL